VRILCVFFVGALACGAAGPAPPPSDARVTVLSVKNLDCSSCADSLVAKLAREPGVHRARFDKKRVELEVVASPGLDVLAAAGRLKGKESYELVPGPGKGSYVPWAETPAGADVKILAVGGEDVPSLEAHLGAGKVTVFDFGAVWCEPCRRLDAHMMKLSEERRDVAYRKLDVGDWDTPLAARYLRRVPELPYVVVYDRAGKKVAAIAGLDLAALDAAIARAAGRGP
jgi:thiol-disulfide isomerase/thioredoxin